MAVNGSVVGALLLQDCTPGMDVMKRKILIIMLAATLTAGCASSGSLSHEMAGMQGAGIDAVIAAWGPPETEATLAGQHVVVWKDRVARDEAIGPVTVICERALALDAEGTVTGWRWRGDACESVDPGQRALAGITAGNATH